MPVFHIVVVDTRCFFVWKRVAWLAFDHVWWRICLPNSSGNVCVSANIVCIWNKVEYCIPLWYVRNELLKRYNFSPFRSFKYDDCCYFNPFTLCIKQATKLRPPLILIEVMRDSVACFMLNSLRNCPLWSGCPRSVTPPLKNAIMLV